MRYEDLVAGVAREVGVLTTAFERVGPGDPVPTCPDWKVLDLATHLGEFIGFWTHVLCEGTGRPKTPWNPAPANDLAPWFAEIGGHLVAELAAASGDTPVWTWSPTDQTAGFVARRCAHELTVHRVDAELVSGSHGPIDPDIAADGIDEMFMIATDGPRAGAAGNGETLHVHGTDRPAEWFVTLAPTGTTVEARHEKADLALRGPVAELELLLYQRPTSAGIERLGDEGVLDAWYRVFTF
ncbi:MAG TPA: maleylpyruvate isomerase family mycothiol-dependent enzyme [Acidimicrobiales bacterium]|nr:maleylpyruvate isomerase family mycothiol-dependent enzyme [Acidimicrobiales bacterium]